MLYHRQGEVQPLIAHPGRPLLHLIRHRACTRLPQKRRSGFDGETIARTSWSPSRKVCCFSTNQMRYLNMSPKMTTCKIPAMYDTKGQWNNPWQIHNMTVMNCWDRALGALSCYYTFAGLNSAMFIIACTPYFEPSLAHTRDWARGGNRAAFASASASIGARSVRTTFASSTGREIRNPVKIIVFIHSSTLRSARNTAKSSVHF